MNPGARPARPLTVAVRFRAGRDELVQALLLDALIFGRPAPTTRRDMLNRLRATFSGHGERMWEVLERGVLTDEIALATEVIDRLFPEFVRQKRQGTGEPLKQEQRERAPRSGNGSRAGSP